MHFLDLRTIYFISILTNAICTLVIFVLWLNSKKRFSGTGLWALDFTFITIAFILIALRGLISDWVSIVLSNFLVITGAFLGLLGLEQFTEKKGRHFHNYLILFAFAIIHTYFTFFKPNLSIRNLNIAVCLFLFCSQCAFHLFYRVGREKINLTFVTGLIFAGFSLINFIRIFHEITGHGLTNDYFKSGTFDIVVFIFYSMFMIMLAFSLSLMVNKSLFLKIKLEEEKFSKAFHSSPYAITLSRPSDGLIFEVNEGFLKITGFKANEVIGKSVLDLNLWENLSDREEALTELSVNGKIHGKEYRFRIKNGNIITGLFSAERIEVNKQMTILSSIGDITQQKKNEENITKLLNEKESLLKEVHHRVKNFMNTVTGLLSLQTYRSKDTETSKIFLDAITTIQGMSVLYDRLYKPDNLKEMSLHEFLSPLIDDIIKVFSSSVKIEVVKEINEIVLGEKFLSQLGIIINELITNTMKYAFQGRESGIIRIKTFKKADVLSVVYEDNGIGLPESFSIEKSSGFGLRLVSMTIIQFNGKLSIENNNGARFIMEFSEF